MKLLAIAVMLSTALTFAAAPAAATGGTAKKPENGAWGVDLSSMDTLTKPGDDFFGYVNGKWVERTEIAADRVEAGGLATLQDKALEQMRAILVEAAADAGAAKGSDRQKMGDWYASFMDEAAIEAAGFMPIKPELDAIAAVSNRQQLVGLLARNHGRLGLKPIPGKHVNGALTLGESIADLAGLVVAYDAYQRSLDNRPAPVLDGYTGDQRFFMAYAQAWRWRGREAVVEQLMRTDPHPPSALRPNTVRNVDAWYQVFGVQPGDKLYLPPAERIRLW